MEKLKNWINLKGLIVALIVFVLFYYSSLSQLIPIIIFDLDLKNLSGTWQVILSMFSNILLLIVLFLIFRKELIKEFKIFKNKFLDNIDTGIKYWLVGLATMMISNMIINFVLNLGQAANEQAVQEMISYSPWIMLINAGLIAPIIEEIIFRKCFKNAFPNKYLFIILSGLVFGSMHVIGNITSPLDWLYVIPYGSLGAAFAIMYQKTDTVYTSTAMHIFHNTALILLSILA